MDVSSIVMIFLVLINESSTCPTSCICYFSSRFNTICIRKGYTRVPNRIPEETNSLNLGYNDIQTVYSNGFHGLTDLEDLKLYGNKIQTIEEDAFQGLSKLMSLYLSSNEISTIHVGAFNGLSSLYYLNLYRNKLTTINPDIFIGPYGLSQLSLSYNVFKCDCNIRRFRLWLLSKPYIGTAQAKCSSGTYITSLRDNAIYCSKEANLEKTCQVLGSTAGCGPNAICKSVDGNLVCKCSDGYYDNNFEATAGTCMPEMPPGRACLRSGESIECVPHANCTDDRGILSCTCSSGYYDSNFGVNGGICVPVKHIGEEYHHQNTNATQCIPNAECKIDGNKHVCKCSEGFKQSPYVCVTDNDPITEAKDDSGNNSLILAVLAFSVVAIATVAHIAVCICRKMRGSPTATDGKPKSNNDNYTNASFDMGQERHVYDQVERKNGD